MTYVVELQVSGADGRTEVIRVRVAVDGPNEISVEPGLSPTADPDGGPAGGAAA
ncbi:hypothetical protein [Streptomyces globisporus]